MALTSLAQGELPRAGATINRPSIEIGEQFEIQLELLVPKSWKEGYGWFSIPDTFNHFEIIERGPIDSSEGKDGLRIRQKLILTSFDSGRWEIPAFGIRAGKDQVVTINDLSMYVSSVPVAGMKDYNEIKDIIEDGAGSNRKWWLMGIIAGVLILLGLALWFIFRKKKKMPETPRLPLQSPLEEALAALQQLRHENLCAGGQVKLHYTRLADVFRDFLQKRTGIRSMEKTSGELLLLLKKKINSEALYFRMAETLRMADAVKFAKYIPEENDHFNNIQAIEACIRELDKTEAPL